MPPTPKEPPGPPRKPCAPPSRAEASLSPRADAFNLAYLTGAPALCLPCGFTAGPPVLPIGIQLPARAFDDSTLLRVARACESAALWYTRIPPLAA